MRLCYNILLTKLRPIARNASGKAKENFKFLGLEVIAFAYKRWSLTRGSKYNLDLNWKLLVFWNNLVPRSLVDEAEGEIWQSKKICFS